MSITLGDASASHPFKTRATFWGVFTGSVHDVGKRLFCLGHVPRPTVKDPLGCKVFVAVRVLSSTATKRVRGKVGCNPCWLSDALEHPIDMALHAIFTPFYRDASVEWCSGLWIQSWQMEKQGPAWGFLGGQGYGQCEQRARQEVVFVWHQGETLFLGRLDPEQPHVESTVGGH
ncbi:ABC transporter permease [Phytophthora palmivora]|uniref:ABC transporter permease n=1 Tax=Phytophthora palmivora TaxID=4796 RepID=A0A2P4Y855_9STRA|nr:ABC transporter permease [Phytophthora palmivora]